MDLTIKTTLLSDFQENLVKQADEYSTSMYKAEAEPRPMNPILPPYPYKYPRIRPRSDYKGNFEEEYWQCWDKNPYDHSVNSWISWTNLENEARMAGYNDIKKLNRTRSILLEGASLGCEGTGRMITVGRNSNTVYQEGRKFADTLNNWVRTKIVYGPFTKNEMPFKEYKVSPMGVAPKPHGKIRIVMDLSYPHDIPADSPKPNSVNKGINKELLHSPMSTTSEVCKKIWSTGYPAEFAKADWTSAYKHISLRPDDRHLQVFEFGGRFFIEGQMTFGASSSPDRFDVVSDVPLEIALLQTGIWKESTVKVLDDAVCIGRKNGGTVGKFYENYRGLCSRVGIQLADDKDDDKAFGPRTKGVVLGIFYNLETLTWSIPNDKADTLLILLWDAATAKQTSYRNLSKIVGKITHYKDMVMFGHYERSWLLKLTDNERPPFEVVRFDETSTRQLKWWIKSIIMAKVGTRIPNPFSYTPRVFLEMFPDASGGLNGALAGAGSCFLTSSQQPWVYLRWPDLIRFNRPNTFNVKFAHKMSTLEAFAALLGVVSEPDLVRNKRLVINTDNSGFYYSYLNGHSRCLYLHSIVKAIHYTSKALNITIHIEKIPRRVSVGAKIADELSKGQLGTAMSLLSDPADLPSSIPKSLIEWITNPYPTRTLGETIMDEISLYTKVLDWGQF